MSTMLRKRRKKVLLGQGHSVKVRYLGDAERPMEFVGVRTKTVYKFGGRFNLGEVDSRDLGTGHSATPGLLQLLDFDGHKLFVEHVPLKEEIEAERAAEARAQEAREAAETLVVPKSPKPPKKAKVAGAVKAADEDPDTSD